MPLSLLAIVGALLIESTVHRSAPFGRLTAGRPHGGATLHADAQQPKANKGAARLAVAPECPGVAERVAAAPPIQGAEQKAAPGCHQSSTQMLAASRAATNVPANL